MVTPNMSLTQPTVLVTTGPTYGNQQNTDLSLIDAHDHSTGKGAALKISTLGSSFVDANMSYTGFGPVNMAYATLTAQALQSKAASLMVNAAGNLYYQNTSGNQIQLTTGAVVNATGTGTLNGFYDLGGTGYSGTPVKAGYDQTQLQYRFSKGVNVDMTSVATAATLAAGAQYLAANSATPIRVGTTWNGATFVPNGGWGFGVTAGTAGYGDTWYLGFDYGTVGAYSTYTAVRVDGLGLGADAANQSWAMSINHGANGSTASGGGADASSLWVGSRNTAGGGGTGTVVATLALQGIRSNGLSNATLGMGPEWAFNCFVTGTDVANGAQYTTRKQGSVGGAWGGTPGTDGGVRIRGAASGTATGTAGFELMNYGGTDSVGIGGAAPNGTYIFKVYGSMYSTASIVSQTGMTCGTSFTVGTTSHFIGAATFDAGITTTTLAMTGALTASNYIASSAGGSAGNAAGFWKNNVCLAWGHYDAAGTFINGYNMSGANAVITNTSQYSMNFANSLTTINTTAMVAMVAQTDIVNPRTAHGMVNTTGGCTVITWAGATKTAAEFYFLIMGQP